MVSTSPPCHDSVDQFYFRPVIPLLFAFIAGIAAARYVPGRSLPITAVMSAAAGVVVYALCLKRNPRVSPLILYACLGYLAFSSWNPQTSAAGHVTRYMGERPWRITGTIVSDPAVYKKRQKYVLDRLALESLDDGGSPFPVKGRIQVTHYGKSFDLPVGYRIGLVGKIRPFTNFNNPGGFDYRGYMEFRHIYGHAYAVGDKLEVIKRDSTASFQACLNSARLRISGLIGRASDGDAQSVLNALLLGNRHRIGPGLRQAFNRAGIGHLLAISGLHVGVVASAAFLFFKWLLSFFRPVLRHAWGGKGAALLSIFPVIVYGLLAGMSPSTQRAVIMVVIFLLSFLLEREHDLINTLAVAAFVILIINPTAIFSISFQLSFTAVLSIIYGMPKTRNMIKNRHALLKPILAFMLVSFFAIIGTMPLVMYYFNQVSIAGFFSNIILVPLIGFIVVPAGLFSVLVLFPVSTNLAFWGIKASGFILRQSIDFVYYIASLPFCAFKTITPSILEIACFYLLLWGCLNLKSDDKESSPPGNGIIRRISSGTNPFRALVAAVLIVFTADTLYWVNRRLWHDDFRVTILDVGQGNSALLEMPKGYCALIDGGGFTDNAVFDIGARVLAPYLWRNKIRTVDTVILTHPDADHLNGLVYILKHFHVKQVLSNHQESGHIEYKEFKRLIREKGISHPGFKTLPRRMAINGVTLEVLHPSEGFGQTGYKSRQSSNNNSMIIRAGFHQHSILFPGDIMKAAEKAVVKRAGDALHATVLIAPHHGSNTSSTQGFLDAVDPEVVIISCGKQNRFGFPAEPVLNRYEDHHCLVYRTDLNGAVRIIFAGGAMTIIPMKFREMQRNADIGLFTKPSTSGG